MTAVQPVPENTPFHFHSMAILAMTAAGLFYGQRRLSLPWVIPVAAAFSLGFVATLSGSHEPQDVQIHNIWNSTQEAVS